MSRFLGHSRITKKPNGTQTVAPRLPCSRRARFVSDAVSRTLGRPSVRCIITTRGFAGSYAHSRPPSIPGSAVSRGRTARCTCDNIKSSNKYVCRRYCCCDIIIGTNFVGRSICPRVFWFTSTINRKRRPARGRSYGFVIIIYTPVQNMYLQL